MDFTKHWTSERARKKQTALTKLSNGLLNEVVNDSFTRELFDQDELDAMRTAANALAKVKQKFAHVKEQKARIEKRKEQELNHIKQQSRKFAHKVYDSFSPPFDSCNKEILCLWVTATKVNPHDFPPERWELDINDNIENHYLASDDELRKRHVWSMRDKALTAFEKYLSYAWRFSFEQDKYIPVKPIKEAAEELRNLINHNEYSKVERCYSDLFESLESYNRNVIALQRRKNIKSV